MIIKGRGKDVSQLAVSFCFDILFLQFEVAALEKREDICSSSDVDYILEGCEDIIPEDDVLARDFVIVALEVEDIGERAWCIGVRGDVLVDAADWLGALFG
jgi:hypothetical protein